MIMCLRRLAETDIDAEDSWKMGEITKEKLLKITMAETHITRKMKSIIDGDDLKNKVETSLQHLRSLSRDA